MKARFPRRLEKLQTWASLEIACKFEPPRWFFEPLSEFLAWHNLHFSDFFGQRLIPFTQYMCPIKLIHAAYKSVFRISECIVTYMRGPPRGHQTCNVASDPVFPKAVLSKGMPNPQIYNAPHPQKQLIEFHPSYAHFSKVCNGCPNFASNEFEWQSCASHARRRAVRWDPSVQIIGN